MTPPLLAVHNLTHRFDERAEIAIGSFTLNAGSILLLRGASGCGKSTLLHLCGAMDRSSSGEIEFADFASYFVDQPDVGVVKFAGKKMKIFYRAW